MDQYTQIKEKIKSLEEAINLKHPSMSTLLQDIHRVTKNDPALVTMLKEEEIHTIIAGLMVQTNTMIAVSAVKGSASKTKALSKVSTDDLGFD